MNSLYFCFIFIYICFVVANEFDTSSLTSRRLLAHHRVQSSIVSEKKTSPVKFARSGATEKRTLPVYIHPSRPSTHKHKTRSYADLLNGKSNKNSKKKKHADKQQNETEKQSTMMSKVRELVPVNEVELDRCRTLLHIEQTSSLPVVKEDSKKTNTKDSKAKEFDETESIKFSAKPKKSSKIVSQPKQDTREPVVSIVNSATINDPPSSNNSFVNRALNFVKNMFQLSDDILEMNSHLKETSNDQRKDENYQSRKLLSMEHFDDEISSVVRSISKRHLLSPKTNKATSNSKRIKEKKVQVATHGNSEKPKVGWTYRYRISRYLAAKNQQQSKLKEKQTKTSNERKLSKRKLLQYDHVDDHISNRDRIDSIKVTQPFRPKRLHNVKPVNARPLNTADDRVHVSHRLKYFDPFLLVASHERHLAQVRQKSNLNQQQSKQIQSQTGSKRKLNEISSQGQRVRRKFSHVERQRTENEIQSDLKTLNNFDQIKISSNDQENGTSQPTDSTSLLQTFISKVHRSACRLSFTTEFSFCNENLLDIDVEENKSRGKLRTKKEHRAKQFIRSHVTKFGAADKATERRVDETMKVLYSNPSLPPPQTPPTKSTRKNRTTNNEPRLRTIAEVIQQRADLFLSSKRTDFRTSEDIQEENNESRRERTKTRRKILIE